MWRALFVGLGFYCCLLGVECLLIEKAVLADRNTSSNSAGLINKFESRITSSREVVPPDWAPWSLMSAGAVTMLYTFTIPKRGKE